MASTLHALLFFALGLFALYQALRLVDANLYIRDLKMEIEDLRRHKQILLERIHAYEVEKKL